MTDAFAAADEPQQLLHFFEEDIEFAPEEPAILRRWLTETAAHEDFTLDEVSYIFCSDAHLLGINLQFLQHDDLTDIITFPYHEGGTVISGDVFISVERIRENAERFGVPFLSELHRVMVHGLLHLVGYVDSTPEDKAFMRQKEDFYLARLNAPAEELDA